MSSEEVKREYRLRGAPGIPMLYDVLVTPSGKIIDGNNRLEEDPNWSRKVVPGTDEPVVYWSVKLQAHNRRRVPEKETAKDLINLKEALVKERGKGIRLIPLLAQYSLLSPTYISELLAKYDPLAEAATLSVYKPRPKPKSVKKRRSKEEEEKEEDKVEEDEGDYLGSERSRSSIPEKGTEQFNDAVQGHVRSLLGLPIDEVVSRLHARFELSEDESKQAITTLKVYEPQLWSRIYNANDQPRQATPRQEDAPQRLPTKTPTFVSDTVYRDSFDWYPSEIIEKVWSHTEAPRDKRSFIKAIFSLCLEETLKTVDEKTLFEAAIAATS